MTKLSQAFDVISEIYDKSKPKKIAPHVFEFTTKPYVLLFDGKFLFISNDDYFNKIITWEIKSESLCLSDLIIPAQYCLKEYRDFVNNYKKYTPSGYPNSPLDWYINFFKDYRSILSEIFDEKHFRNILIEKEILLEDETPNTKDLPLIIY
jgi:hypothetical protein